MLSLVAVLLGLAHGAVDAAIEWLFPHEDPDWSAEAMADV
jgi:hypothetical protein